MVEVDELDLTTASVEPRGSATHAPRPSHDAWTWVGVGISLVLVALLATPRPLPPLSTGVLQGDLRRPPEEVWSVALPASLADDVARWQGGPAFTGTLRVSTGEPRVVVAAGLVGVAGFDAATGALLWEHEISGTFCEVTTAVTCVHAVGKWRASVSLVDVVTGERTVLEVPGAGHAVAVDRPGGEELVAAAGTAAVLGADGSGTWVTVLDARGGERWRTLLPGRLGTDTLLSAGDSLYLGGTAPAVLDVGTGAVVARPARVQPGAEGAVEVVDGEGAATVVLPDGERLRPGEDVAAVRVTHAEGGRLPGAPWPLVLGDDGHGTGTAAVDVATGEVLWTVPATMSASTVVDGDLVGVTDGRLVRWSW